MIELLDKISKQHNSKKIVDLIKNKNFGDLEKIKNDDIKFLSKLLLLNLKALADKGMKTKAHMLSQEYYSQEDLDGDGKIYGIDWIYKNPPPVLQSIKPEKYPTDERIFEPRRK